MTGIPQLLTALAHMHNPSLLSPSTAVRISINTGPNSFYGEKYKVEKVMSQFHCSRFSLSYSLPYSRCSKMMAKLCLDLLLLYTIPNERSFSWMVCLSFNLTAGSQSVRLTVDIRNFIPSTCSVYYLKHENENLFLWSKQVTESRLSGAKIYDIWINPSQSHRQEL